MSSSSKPSTPHSSSRSKRSTTNLANLRLAPLSAKFTDDTPDSSSIDGQTDAFAKLTASHRSAPTTPRILSRSSSRKYLGGLSRRSSLYENDGSERQDEGSPYHYTADVAHEETRPSGPRLEVSSGRVPKAKSEAALGIPSRQQHHRLAGPGVPVRRKYNPYHPHPHAHSTRTSGISTPRVRLRPAGAGAEDADDWLARTAQGVHSALAEQKGQSFILSRNSRSVLALDTHAHLTDDEDEDDDEGYEELAALSARSSTARSGFAADDEWSPLSTRASRWGSRYGSRRTSRRGSAVGFSTVSGSRTPLASAQVREDGRSGYFDPHPAGLPVEPEFLDAEDSSADEEGAVGGRFTSLGGLVDRLIGFPLFNVDEGRETGTESEADESTGGAGGGIGRGVGDTETETETEARRRIGAENARREGEKERLRDAQRRRFREGGEGEGGGWEDARWLFGRAREAWL